MNANSEPSVRRGLLAAAAGLATQAILPVAAFAQSSQLVFPSQNVRMVVPALPGSASDLAGRQLAKFLSSALGRQVLIENRAGADGAIASVEVARAVPDGHTIYFGTASGMTYVPIVRRNPGYSLSDFAPLTHFVSYTFFIAVHESVPGNNLREVLTHVRKHPGKFSYGSGNSSGILAMALLMDASKTEMVHVPYKGEANASLDLATGRIQMMVVTPAVLPQLMKDGKVRPVCVLLKDRSALMPEVPTIEESGEPLMDMALWGGFFAPANTPRSVVDSLSKALVAAINLPQMKATLDALGLIPRSDSPEGFSAFLERQAKNWRKAIELAKIPIEA